MPETKPGPGHNSNREVGGPTLAREDDPRPALLNDPFSSEPLFP